MPAGLLNMDRIACAITTPSFACPPSAGLPLYGVSATPSVLDPPPPIPRPTRPRFTSLPHATRIQAPTDKLRQRDADGGTDSLGFADKGTEARSRTSDPTGRLGDPWGGLAQ